MSYSIIQLYHKTYAILQGVHWNWASFNSFVAVYHGDGSVIVSHGGIETGQGIHTKVAQVCAQELKIPIELIKVQSADNIAGANSGPTGGSIASELVCMVSVI